MCVYRYIYTYIHGKVPEDLLNFPEMLPLLWNGGFQRPYFKSEILAKSQPITLRRRWATLNQTQSTFQRLPVQNNQYFTLNRALTSHMVRTGGCNGIGKSCTFLWRFGDGKGIGSGYHLKGPIWKKFLVELQDQIGFRQELIDMNLRREN